MVIDNSNYTVKNKLLRLALLVVTAGLIAYVSILAEGDSWFHISRQYYSLIIFSVYVIYNTYRILRKYYFIYFSTDLGKITVRFYHITTFFKKCQFFEFPLTEFHTFEIQKKWLHTSLIIYRKQGNKITKYPPISITSLKRSEIDQIVNTLQNIKTYSI